MCTYGESRSKNLRTPLDQFAKFGEPKVAIIALLGISAISGAHHPKIEGKKP
jgi:hypothetical protein